MTDMARMCQDTLYNPAFVRALFDEMAATFRPPPAETP
jgi:hypothetical protein